MSYRNSRAATFSSELNFSLGRICWPGSNVEVEDDPLWSDPLDDAAEFKFVAVAGALEEPAVGIQVECASRVVGMASFRRPPHANLLGKKPEGRIRRHAKEHGLGNHRLESSSRRASAVSQKSSRNSRTEAKPCIRME